MSVTKERVEAEGAPTRWEEKAAGMQPTETKAGPEMANRRFDNGGRLRLSPVNS